MAFIDLISDHPELAFAAVDTDYDCGVFGRGDARPPCHAT